MNRSIQREDHEDPPLPGDRKPFSKAAKIVGHYFTIGVALSGTLIAVSGLLALVYVLGYIVLSKIGIVSFPMGAVLKPAVIVLIVAHVAIQVGSYGFILKKADSLD